MTAFSRSAFLLSFLSDFLLRCVETMEKVDPSSDVHYTNIKWARVRDNFGFKRIRFKILVFFWFFDKLYCDDTMENTGKFSSSISG